MKFSYNWFQSYFKSKLPEPEKLAQILTMKFAEVEQVRKRGNDYILDIDVRPNRAGDCFSHLGVSREIAAILNLKQKAKTNEKLNENKTLKAKDFLKVEIKDKSVCPRYTARVITDAKVISSPVWMQQRLQTCGLRPINNIVDIANYVMLETGQPLHAFDGNKLLGHKIIVRFANQGEKLTTLDNQDFVLDKSVLVIADTQKALGIAGIKGGGNSGVDRKTKTVVLESANFNPLTIRRGSKKLGLRTDASTRFEHGLDPNLTATAIDRAALLMQELAKGKVCSGRVDFYPQKVLPRKIVLHIDKVNSLLGTDLESVQVRQLLAKLGLESSGATVKIPTLRQDLNIEQDLIEEVGRLFGYEKIKAVMPQVLLIPPPVNFEVFWQDKIRDCLKQAGFTEIWNYNFVSERDDEIFAFPKRNLVELDNPLSLEFKFLRPSLLPNLLKNIEKNIVNFPEIMIFELGKVFNKQGLDVSEKTMVAGMTNADNLPFIKGTAEFLLKALGVAGKIKLCSCLAKENNWFRPKQTGLIFARNQEIGSLGQVSPEILRKLGIDEKLKIIYFEFSFERMQELVSSQKVYQPLPKYPVVTRDLAVLVPEQTSLEEVEKEININASPLLTKIDLFDSYQGKGLPGKTKSFAFRLIFQAPDRTLTSQEIDAVIKQIVENLEKNPHWHVRR